MQPFCKKAAKKRYAESQFCSTEIVPWHYHNSFATCGPTMRQLTLRAWSLSQRKSADILQLFPNTFKTVRSNWVLAQWNSDYGDNDFSVKSEILLFPDALPLLCPLFPMSGAITPLINWKYGTEGFSFEYSPRKEFIRSLKENIVIVISCWSFFPSKSRTVKISSFLHFRFVTINRSLLVSPGIRS